MTAIRLRNARLVTAYTVMHHDLCINGAHFTTQIDSAFEMDLRGHDVLPGLINTHDHLQLNAIPPLPHSQPFANSYVWAEAFQPHFENAAVKKAVAVPSETRHWHGALKNVLCGATTVMHHDPWKPILAHKDFPVRVLRNFGWAHSLRLAYGPPVRESYMQTPPAQGWFIHLAEGTDDVAKGELAELDALGCLGCNTQLIHGVGLQEADIARIVASGAGVIWCPASNLSMLGETIAPGKLRQLFDAGLLALGTDSRLTGAFDLLDELRMAAQHSDLSANELLRLVTCSASALLRMNKVGGLAVGQHADLLIMRQSNDDPYDALLKLVRKDIRAVVRDGKPVIADLDFEAWFDHCQVDVARVSLDGAPKLCARSILHKDAVVLEPGLEVMA